MAQALRRFAGLPADASERTPPPREINVAAS